MHATRSGWSRRAGCVLLGTALIGADLPALAGKAAEVRVESFQQLNKGVAAFNRGEFALAIEHLRQAAAISLNSFRAHYYLGLAQAGDRRYAEAVETLGVALDLDPNHLASHAAQGDAWLKLGDIGEARAAYYRATKLRPGYAMALDGLARCYEAQADDANAVETYRQAILSDRGFAPAYSHLGDLYLRQDRLEEAVRLLEEAITIRPDFAPGLNRLALAYGRMGLNNQAVATVQRAIELEPGNANHPETLGRLQMEQGFLNSAERSFDNALRLDPHLAEARMGLAEVARRRGEYDLAVEELELGLEDPRVEAAARAALEALRETIRTEATEAAALAARVAADALTEPERGRLAEIYAGRGNWDDAIRIQRGASDDAAGRERLAYLLTRAGRYREALGLYEALALETGRIDLLLNQAISEALLGDDVSASALYAQVLTREPAHPLARLYLANARLRLGRTAEAARAYRSFLDLGEESEAAERVRRILRQIAPELVPAAVELPILAPAPPAPEPRDEEAT